METSQQTKTHSVTRRSVLEGNIKVLLNIVNTILQENSKGSFWRRWMNLDSCEEMQEGTKSNNKVTKEEQQKVNMWINLVNTDYIKQ